MGTWTTRLRRNHHIVLCTQGSLENQELYDHFGEIIFVFIVVVIVIVVVVVVVVIVSVVDGVAVVAVTAVAAPVVVVVVVVVSFIFNGIMQQMGLLIWSLCRLLYIHTHIQCVGR